MLRTGQALPLKEPVKYQFSGEIDSVVAFIIKMEHLMSQDSIVEIDRNKLEIKLYALPANQYGAVVSGSLTISKYLDAFRINKTQYRSKDELVKLLRFNRVFFANQDEYSTLLLKLKSLRVKTAGELEDAKDNKGNRRELYDKQVNADLPGSFMLSVPIFEGHPAVKFPVELAFEEYDGNIRFWLESPELAEITEKIGQEILSGEATQIEDAGVLVLWK